MNNEEFNIEFFDEKIWAKGDTGETPIVTIDASVDNTVGTPSVDVNKTGDAEHPHFDIDFKHIKGEKGNTGATPNMTINATVNQTIGEASVEVEQTGTPEHPRFDIAFSGVKGEKGDKGDTGYTPNIEVGASVDNTVGTPNVTVSKTGTPENPRLEFDFKHLKGVKGEKGDTGTTPNISMSATVGQSIGTPSVNVSKSGSAENPSFTLAFNNIKGEKGDKGDKGDQGDDGLDGFKNRLTEKTDILPTDCVPINEADGTAKYTTTKNLLADVRDKLEFLTDLVDCNALITSPNNIMRAQYANQNNATNTPSASSYRVLTINQTQNYASQIAIDVNRNNRMFIRSKVGGTWSDWEKLVTATELAAKYPQTVRLGAINTVDLTANTEVSATIPDWNEMIGDKPKYKEFWVSLSYSGHIQQRIPMTYTEFSNIVGSPRSRSIWITDLFSSENYDYEVFVKNDDTTKFYALSKGKNGANGKSIVLNGITY